MKTHIMNYTKRIIRNIKSWVVDQSVDEDYLRISVLDCALEDAILNFKSSEWHWLFWLDPDEIQKRFFAKNILVMQQAWVPFFLNFTIKVLPVVVVIEFFAKIPIYLVEGWNGILIMFFVFSLVILLLNILTQISSYKPKSRLTKDFANELLCFVQNDPSGGLSAIKDELDARYTSERRNRMIILINYIPAIVYTLKVWPYSEWAIYLITLAVLSISLSRITLVIKKQAILRIAMIKCYRELSTRTIPTL